MTVEDPAREVGHQPLIERELERAPPAVQIFLELATGPIELARGGQHPRRDPAGEIGEALVLLAGGDVVDPDQSVGCAGQQQASHRGVHGRVGDVEQSRLRGGGTHVWQVLGRRGAVTTQAAFDRVELGHGWYSSRRRFKPSWTLRRAASGLVSIAAAMSA